MMVFRWRYIPNLKEVNNKELFASLLVVARPDYIRFAEIATLSFFFYHPKSKVRIYCDSITIKETRMRFKREISKGQVKVELVKREELSWQEHKVEIILSLESKNHFFMDCDLRFNSKLPDLQAPLFFVREYNLCENIDMKNILNKLDRIKGHKEIFMWNSSFVYWDSYTSILLKTGLSFSDFEKFLKYALSNITESKRNEIWRLREQLYLSVLAGLSGIPLNSLKSEDKRLDGSFLESVYFGSTGLSF